MENKDLVVFTACDQNNLKYARVFLKSFKHFHPDVPLVLFTDAKVENIEGVRVLPLLTKDPMVWYKQKPFFADRLFREGYKAVLGADADQIVLGNLDNVLYSKGYDVGTVLNFNPIDYASLGPITVQGVHYATEYYNAGLVMMRSHKFVRHWLRLCEGKFFERFTYREQDLLNILCHFGEYQVFCFDDADDFNKYYAWHGLLGSRSTMQMLMHKGNVVLPAQPTGFPNRDIVYKVWHPASGQQTYDKMNFRTSFNEEVIRYIDEILGTDAK